MCPRVRRGSKVKGGPQGPSLATPRAWARRVAARELARRVAELDYEILTDQVPERPALLANNADLSEQSRRIVAAIQELPPRQRQIMAWTYDGYAPAEIAEELDITPEAVRSSLRKARRSLIERLTQGKGSR
ncbi:sigma-70 family RNA polymerase sigma factor [Couchioplanes caeruleus]|uniref:sigma-70 family RNA polymerase sigma factor n=1 Tax=Couchioplanes caeruleus TaxID=56438 RepID=UPI0009FC5049|nr:sigma-70 family RNA polymerase sigma factor [Couchioplanes caeruleus]